MKEITHEEVRNLFGGTECSFDGCPDETKKLHDYITQQEKKDKLLELYENHHYHLLQGNIGPMLRIREKIRIISGELK